MNKCVQQITDAYYKYKDYKDIEIESRLGFFNIGKFDTNVTQKIFEKIKSKFNGTDIWDNIENINKTDYFYEKIRISIEDDVLQSVSKRKN